MDGGGSVTWHARHVRAAFGSCICAPSCPAPAPGGPVLASPWRGLLRPRRRAEAGSSAPAAGRCEPRPAARQHDRVLAGSHVFAAGARTGGRLLIGARGHGCLPLGDLRECPPVRNLEVFGLRAVSAAKVLIEGIRIVGGVAARAPVLRGLPLPWVAGHLGHAAAAERQPLWYGQRG